MRIVFALLLFATVGCRTVTPEEKKAGYVKWFVYEERHTPKSLNRQLTPGMKREQVHAFYQRQPRFKREPITSHLRPKTGWTAAAHDTNAHTYRVVSTYEWLHEKRVQRCDVFESPAGHSYIIVFQPDIDYLFYDSSDHLIGFHHEIVGD